MEGEGHSRLRESKLRAQRPRLVSSWHPPAAKSGMSQKRRNAQPASSAGIGAWKATLRACCGFPYWNGQPSPEAYPVGKVTTSPLLQGQGGQQLQKAVFCCTVCAPRSPCLLPPGLEAKVRVAHCKATVEDLVSICLFASLSQTLGCGIAPSGSAGMRTYFSQPVAPTYITL